MEIVKMNAAHTAQVAALEQQCFSTPWSENAIVHELSNPISLWYVAVDNDRVVGYVGSQFGYGEADMMNLAVDATCRRMGIAQRLVETLISGLTQQEVTKLTLDVRQSNTPAICLYENMGFQQIGIRPNYYQKPKEAALILAKEW